MGIPERYNDTMWETSTPGYYWRWRFATSLKRGELSAVLGIVGVPLLMIDRKKRKPK